MTEMDVVQETKAEVVESAPEAPKVDQVSKVVSDFKKNITYITKGIDTNQPRLIQKAIRQHVNIRRSSTKADLLNIAKSHIPSGCPTYSHVIEAIEKIPGEDDTKTDAMDVDTATSTNLPITVLPEVELYIFTTVIMVLLRENKLNEAAYTSNFVIERIRQFNRRSLDLISSKAYFYYSLAYEKNNRLEYIRPTLLALYRTTCIRHDIMGQAILLNLILRNYLSYNLIEAAHTFSLRTSFPETASNNQYCRYLYYMGRIQAIQLEYSEAYQRLMLAIRKAPQDCAQGFTVIVTKLSIIVQLLMGEIPEKRIFSPPELRVPLAPYFTLTQAVRNGDLQQFNEIVQQYEESFKNDNNLSLVHRLGHNVLKTGLRKLSLSYSRISLADVAEKLHLSSASSAEYICAKAIRDGVIEATIDHNNGWLVSTDVTDIYSTEEPQNAFHKRIAFCLDVYNESVRNMRYPPDAYKKILQASNTKDGKSGNSNNSNEEEKTIEELIKELEEDFDE